MATKKTSPQKTSSKKAPSSKGASAKKKPSSGSSEPKKKPGRPKKMSSTASPKPKAASPGQEAKDAARRPHVQIMDDAVANVQITGAQIPSNVATTSATGATPEVNINLSWQKSTKKGFWARIASSLGLKK